MKVDVHTMKTHRRERDGADDTKALAAGYQNEDKI
jgi:hypothetical protein